MASGNVYRDGVIDECIKVLDAAFDEHKRSNEAQGLLHAIEVLETLKSTKNGGAA
jgi:hypothetical protein